MAGFETIVRPVVLPNIRPTPKQSVRPQEVSSGDPEKGMCVIRGTSGKIVQLPYSFNASSSSSNLTETKRRVDEARVYQETADGTVNKDNFVDLEVTNKIWMKGGKSATPTYKGFTGDDVVPTIPGRGYTGDDISSRTYARVKEKPNIEIRKRDQIKENKEGGG